MAKVKVEGTVGKKETRDPKDIRQEFMNWSARLGEIDYQMTIVLPNEQMAIRAKQRDLDNEFIKANEAKNALGQ